MGCTITSSLRSKLKWMPWWSCRMEHQVSGILSLTIHQATWKRQQQQDLHMESWRLFDWEFSRKKKSILERLERQSKRLRITYRRKANWGRSLSAHQSLEMWLNTKRSPSRVCLMDKASRFLLWQSTSEPCYDSRCGDFLRFVIFTCSCVPWWTGMK